MQDFIVLGIIPGTDIQIDFVGWLQIAASLALTYFLFSFIIRHRRKITDVIVPAVVASLPENLVTVPNDIANITL